MASVAVAPIDSEILVYSSCCALPKIKNRLQHPELRSWVISKYIEIYRDCIGLYWGYIRIMEKKMETTIGFRIYGLKFRLWV